MFLTLSFDNVHDGDASHGYEVFFSPKPAKEEFPAVWLDLHVGGDRYQRTGDDDRARKFDTSKDGERRIRIRPGHSVRVTTQEHIGLSTKRTAIVMNVASRAKHGLVIAPGKIDPGFNPSPLVLVIYNQSSRVITLKPGDKVACVAVAELSTESPATKSHGHALLSAGVDFEPTVWNRLKRSAATIDYASIPTAAFRYAIMPILVLWVAYTCGLKR